MTTQVAAASSFRLSPVKLSLAYHIPAQATVAMKNGLPLCTGMAESSSGAQTSCDEVTNCVDVVDPNFVTRHCEGTCVNMAIGT